MAVMPDRQTPAQAGLFDPPTADAARDAGAADAEIRSDAAAAGEPLPLPAFLAPADAAAEAAARILQRLQDAQVGTALDDFGTGYSSLSYVHRFPLRSIKIDRSFISDLGQADARRSLAIIEAVQGLARSLSLSVVAEGAETEAQRQALLAAGCPCAQGFLFGRQHPAGHWQAGTASTA